MDSKPIIAWANDDRDAVSTWSRTRQTLLPYQVWRHEVGTDRSEDVLVFEESDPPFIRPVYKSRSDDYIVIAMNSTDASEIRLIDADQPAQEPEVFLPRQADHEYRVRHVPGWFYVISNREAHNFRLMRTPEDKIGTRSAWEEVVPHRDDVLLQDVEVFAGHVVVSERQSGLTRLRVIDRRSGEEKPIEFEDAAYTTRLHSNPQLDTSKLRFVYSSLTTPRSVIEYDMATGISKLLKQRDVLGNFDPQNYTSERLYIEARDGTQVPVSLVYRPDRRIPGKSPLYVTGYGAYGISSNPSFRTLRLSHARSRVRLRHRPRPRRPGNRRGWYEDGKLLNKSEYVQRLHRCDTRARHERAMATPTRSLPAAAVGWRFADGCHCQRSAGTLPRHHRACPVRRCDDDDAGRDDPADDRRILGMGQPAKEKVLRLHVELLTLRSGLRAGLPAYAGDDRLQDSQVQYFEPVKWVQKIRAHDTGDNFQLLRVNMETGHNGASGRYERYRVDALEYAFILHVLEKS
ncbi:MAG: prolyl oligopeptidase family serine peptidase [Gammaproteobacteria bacterium]|nr:prolyl oligopeptidase family serine peptidase [Gammaproteobacteria bacterium]